MFKRRSLFLFQFGQPKDRLKFRLGLFVQRYGKESPRSISGVLFVRGIWLIYVNYSVLVHAELY